MNKIALFGTLAVTAILSAGSLHAATPFEKATAIGGTADDVVASKCANAGYNDRVPVLLVTETFTTAQAGTVYDGEVGGYVRQVEVKNPCYMKGDK